MATVFVRPGRTAFAVIPSLATSFAKPLMKPRAPRGLLLRFSLASTFAGRLESCRPPEQIVDHDVGLLVQFGEALVYVPTLEMCPKRRNGKTSRNLRDPQ